MCWNSNHVPITSSGISKGSIYVTTNTGIRAEETGEHQQDSIGFWDQFCLCFIKLKHNLTDYDWLLKIILQCFWSFSHDQSIINGDIAGSFYFGHNLMLKTEENVISFRPSEIYQCAKNADPASNSFCVLALTPRTCSCGTNDSIISIFWGI